MAANEKFILDFVTRGVDNIDRANTKIQDLNGRINGLATALLGVSFAGFISGSLQAADRLVDFSDATNISIASLKALQASMDIAGGSGKNLERSINTLFAAIETANGGSQAARDAFAAVEVSLSDLKNLSETDILQKTLEGLAKMPVGAERSAVATQLLSRAMRSVDPRTLLESLDPEKYRASEEAAKKAAERIGQIEEAYRNLQEGALRAMEPILNLMGEQNLTVEAGTKIVQGLAIAFGVIFGAQAIASVAGMVVALAKFNAALGVTAGLSNLLGKTPLGIILKIGAGAAAGAGIGFAIEELIGKNDELTKSANQAAAAQSGVTGAPTPGTGRITQATPTAGSANRPQELGPREKAIIESNRRIAQSKLEVDKLTALKGADEIKKIEVERDGEIAKAREEIFAKENLNRGQKDREIAAKRKEIETRAELEIARIRKDQQDQLLQQRQGYFDQVSTLLGYEKTELQKINDEIARQPDKYKEIGEQLRSNASIQDRNLRFIKEFNAEQERSKKLSKEGFDLGVDYGLTQSSLVREQERSIELMNARNSAEKLAINERFNREERMATFAASRLTDEIKIATALDLQGDATGQQVQTLLDYYSLLQQQLKLEESLSSIRLFNATQLSDLQNDFRYGWDEAFQAYAESANNAGQQARDSFATFTGGMEDALVEFVQTGKLSFKSLANSIIADLVRIAVRRAIVGIVGGPLGSLFGGGRSAGGPVNAGTPYMVGERGPELFVPQSAGKVVSNAGLKGSGQPAGGSGGGQTTVNYNIQAVDAASFRSMVAKDPSFIYAVTEQGRRSQPTRSR